MSELGIQLYSISDIDDSLSTVLERVGETDFDGVEFAGLGDTGIEDVATALDATGLAVAGAHVGIDALRDKQETTVESYRTLDCNDLVLPYYDEEHFESRAAVEETAAEFDALADALADHGVRFHYHNHDHELVELEDGTPALEALIEATDNTYFEVDLGWVGAAGHDPVSFFERHVDDIRLVHLKDYVAGTRDGAEIGEGDLDVDACVDAVNDHDVEWGIYEYEDRRDSYETVDVGAERLAPRFA